MAVEVKVPAVGESITEVIISEWMKQDGDFVEMDEVIAELESDKASFELNAEEAGILHIKAQEGDAVEVGAVVCEIEPSEGEGSSNGEEEAAPASEPAKPTQPQEEPAPAVTGSSSPGGGEIVELKIPAVGESITEVTISEWLKESGETVEMDEAIAEIESDKATFELTAEADGVLEIVAPAGETLEIGTLAAKITTGANGQSGPSTTAPAPEPAAASAPSGGSNGENTYATGHASPAAAKVLAEKGLSANEVKGTGKDGRVTKEDAMNAQKVVPAPAPAPPKPAAEPKQPVKPAPAKSAPAHTASGSRQQRREKMSNLRKTIARRLVAAKNETAMLTTFNEVDMKPLMDFRKKYKEQFKEKYEVNLGFMSFFAKAACMALQEFPAVNAFIDGEEIVYNDYCDVSIAVSTPRGLVVPVIRNAEKLSFHGVEQEIINLAKKGRDGKLSIEEMTGGTFSITNGGVFGSMLSTPIINPPQSAILGMHNIVERPVAVNGQVEVRPVMYVAVSYDHRIIDGKEAVSFLVRIKEFIEDPARMLIGV